MLLHEVFESVARRYPARVAVEHPPPPGGGERRTLTYAELDARADDLAGRLAACVEGEGVVGILLPRGPDLYVAQLAVLKAGAAYTCLDPAYPDERLRFVVEDAELVCAVTTPELAPRLGLPPGRVLDPAPTGARRRPQPDWVDERSLAYVIYTSGTTGRPKGVMIEHQGVVNLVQSDVERFGLGPDDRVAQGSTPAYDSSVEETWLAFAVGATVLVVDEWVSRLGPDLVPWLRDERVTVFCPPPTLLRATGCEDPRAALPDLRLLYVGGEALPQDLADRWAAGRRMENGYGPTECTVTVMRAAVTPGEPVTIGQPVRGHVAHVLDEALAPVPNGGMGELCISGVGVARGYLRRPELTAERFVDHPVRGRLYRTGDLVRRLPTGDHEYLGRIDAQVKIRGHRVELGEVEAHLLGLEGVREAACKLQGGQLVAFVVEDGSFDPEASRARLRAALPEHMVPARFGTLPSLPTLASGKLDRKALPDLRADRAPVAEPRGPAEARVLAAFGEALEVPVGLEDDFFDLGGDSLAAAEVVSALRGDPLTAALTVRDLYDAPTVAGLAVRATGQAPTPRERPEPPRGSPWRCGAVQLAWMGVTGYVVALLGYWLAFVAAPWVLLRVPLVPLLLALPVLTLLVAALWAPVGLGLAVLAKRALVGRYRPGVYPLYGSLYLRHWLLGRFMGLVPWTLLRWTALEAVCLRALGARVGRRVHLHDGLRGALDLVELGDEASIGRGATLRSIDYLDGAMVVGPIRVGAGATLETRAGMGPDSELGAGARLTALSMLPSGARAPAGEVWTGVPATSQGANGPPAEPADRAWSPAVHAVAFILARFGFGLLAGLPLLLLMLAAIALWSIDGAGVVEWLYSARMGSVASWIVVLWTVGLGVAVYTDALAMRLLGRVRAGVWSRWGGQHLRAALKQGGLAVAGNVLSGTMFWPTWLRLAGMRVGPKCEISTIVDVTPELVELGRESFLADGIYLGTPVVDRGAVALEPVRLGAGTFLGNHVVIPPGTSLPDGILLGVCTVGDPDRVRPGSSWFGLPAFELPRREVIEWDRAATHDPPWWRYATRWLWEAARFLLPALPVLALLGWFKVVEVARPVVGAGLVPFVVAPAYVFAAALAFAALVVATKWVLIGRVRPGQHPLWSCWCSRWDFLYVAWGAYARPLAGALEGTPLIAWWLRLFGVHVGRDVYLAGPFGQVVDPDMLRFEDRATVANMFQAHSFEDRVLKVGPVRIGREATVGPAAVLLYGANVEDRALVEAHSVVMKRETLNVGVRYVGCPTRPG